MTKEKNTKTKENVYYLKDEDKKYIANFCKIQIENNDLIRVKSLCCLLKEKYACFEVLNYIKEVLKVENKHIFKGDKVKYIRQLRDRKHYQLMNDVHFPNCYLHQYVLAKELDIDIEEIRKYVIHHIDLNKENNSIENLFIFFDTSSHISLHQALRYSNNAEIDINELNDDYIESILNNENSRQIKEYLKIVDKLKKAKKNNLVSANTKLLIV